MATKIAEAIGFTEEHEKATGHTALWKFGVLNPQAEHGFPVYCFLGQTSSQLDNIVNQLCMGEQTFLLIAATSSLISTASSDASSRHKSKLIGNFVGAEKASIERQRHGNSNLSQTL